MGDARRRQQQKDDERHGFYKPAGVRDIQVVFESGKEPC
jgi:hypothetical protein